MTQEEKQAMVQSVAVDGIRKMQERSKADGAALKEQIQAGQKEDKQESFSLPAGAKDFQIVTADDLDTWQDPEWWLHSLFPKYGVGQLYGDSGAGKSFVAIDLAHALATGSNWFGWEFIPDDGRHPHVIYMALEGSSGVKLRINALKKREAERRGLQRYTMPDFHLSKVSLDITNLQDVDALAKQINALSGGVPPVVIIDTMQQSMPALDFSASKDMSLVVKKAMELQTAINGFVLLVAHMAKSGDPSKGSFGSIVQKGIMDLQIYVEKIEGSKIRKFTVMKLKDGIDGEVRGFSLCERSLGQDKYGKPLSSATVERETVPQDLKVTKTQLEMLQSLESAYLAEGKQFTEPLDFDAWKRVIATDYDIDGEKLRNKANNWKRTLHRIHVIDVQGNSIRLLKNTGSAPCV